MNKKEIAEQNMREIQSSFGYKLINPGLLYFAILIWHLFTHVSTISCLYFLRIYVFGYENKSEELGMKNYVKQLGIPKLIFMILITIGINGLFLTLDNIRLVYLHTLGFYVATYLLIKVTGFDLKGYIIDFL